MDDDDDDDDDNDHDDGDDNDLTIATGSDGYAKFAHHLQCTT